jgi:hypothetical protein
VTETLGGSEAPHHPEVATAVAKLTGLLNADGTRNASKFGNAGDAREAVRHPGGPLALEFDSSQR